MDKQKPFFLSPTEAFQLQEETYLKVRNLEGRLLSDEIVKNLPNTSKSNPYAKEWRWRNQSLLRLKKYLLAQHGVAMRILDLGCGNGWMSNRLAEIPTWEVVGIDVNQVELIQAARLFGRENLQFFYAHLPDLGLSAPDAIGQFDCIVLAASLQYFPDLEALVSYLKLLLCQGGEIHVIDTHFYHDEVAAAAAKQRTVDYYSNLGVPEMAFFYHHHLWDTMQRLGAENLNGGIWQKWQQKAGIIGPFPWLRLRFS